MQGTRVIVQKGKLAFSGTYLRKEERFSFFERNMWVFTKFRDPMTYIRSYRTTEIQPLQRLHNSGVLKFLASLKRVFNPSMSHIIIFK